MTDCMKTGLAVGGAATGITLLVSYLCYKEGHANGHSAGLAEGVALSEKKYNDLRQKSEEQEKHIQWLQKTKQQALRDQSVLKATIGELCNNLKGHVSDDVYYKISAYLNRTGSKGIAGIIDEAVEELKEGLKAINSSPAKGRIVETKKFSGRVGRVTPPHCEGCAVSSWPESKTRIVFSSEIKGWYFWPYPHKPLLPKESVLEQYPRLIRRIQELIPGWDFDERNRYAKLEKEFEYLSHHAPACDPVMDYDFMAVCANAMHELEGRVFTCCKCTFANKKKSAPAEKDDERVAPGAASEYSCDDDSWYTDIRSLIGLRTNQCNPNNYDPSENDGIDIDYGNGTVECEKLDEYLTQKYNEAVEAVNAFWTLMSDVEREEVEKCRQIFQAISNGDSVTGRLRIVDGSPVIDFCRDLNIPLKISDKAPLYFEGERLTIDKNKDLRKLFLKILPVWKNAQISDGRILGVIGNIKEDCRMRGQKPQLPARGAVREHLRFEDAGTLLRNKILKSYEGKSFACEYVSLKRENGVVTEESSARSEELKKLVGREFEAAQNLLNDFAATRNGRLYSSDDLFPRYTDRVYYQKWDKFDRLTEQRRHRVGDIVSGVVREIKGYGAFVDFDNMSGFLHISNIRDEYIRDIRKVLSVGQHVTAKIIKMGGGKIELSMRESSSLRRLHKRDKALSCREEHSFHGGAGLVGIILVAVVFGLIFGLKFALP